MKKTLNKILFFGNERLASGVTTTTPTLRALLAAGYDVTGVVVAQREPGASRSAREQEIVQVAEAHGIRVFSPDQPRHIEAELRALGAEIGVLAAYGKIVPASIIDTFPHGIVNIHPSLLPLHRGPTPIESAILNGEQETGVSIMQLAVGMDSGPVYGQTAVRLRGDETKAELAEHLLDIGKDMVIELLPGILDGSRTPAPQDHSKATYDKLLTKKLSRLNWEKPAVQLAREVRAYAGWPRSRAVVAGTEAVVFQAHAVSGGGNPGDIHTGNRELSVSTGDGRLVIDMLIPAGKKAMTGQAFIAGYLNQRS